MFHYPSLKPQRYVSKIALAIGAFLKTSVHLKLVYLILQISCVGYDKVSLGLTSYEWISALERELE